MKQIPLTQGKFALVDDADFEALNKYRWCATKRRNTFYAERGSKKNGKQCSYKMHRVVMSAPRGMFVDHINHNGLDNRKVNLRIVTCRENTQNRLPNGSSKFPGVYFHQENRNWISHISVNGKNIHLGVFENEEDAKTCYEIACADLQNGKKIKPKREHTTSRYKGVYWHKASMKWMARIQVNRKRVYLGCFPNEVDAAKVYDAKTRELFGEYACTNFPNE